MCGLIGIASVSAVENRSWLISGRDAMAHRGPDDAGEWWSREGRVGLAHRRLSILDLSPAGHQPMCDASGLISIVFNGEIYNCHELREELAARGTVFRSRTDTEVILAAYGEWGTDCLARLDGMFAFAIYDERHRQIFLARDRAGEKPLYYHLANGTIRFASELKGLMADTTLPRRIDPEALDCYLALGYVPGWRCILKGFNKLPPGHALCFDIGNGDAKVWRYWELPELRLPTATNQTDDLALLDELEALLDGAVRRQLQADVPVGVLLSGGVDSSLVTAMAARSSKQKVKTFTIRFPGYGQFDETEHARLIARHFHTEHVELEASPVDVGLLPDLARQFDEPMVDSSMIPTFLVSRLVRQHCTVVLGGDGGDELFGGYPAYSRMLWMQARLRLVPRPLRQAMAFAAEHLMPVGLKGRNWLQGLNADFRCGVPMVKFQFDPTTRRRLMMDYADWRTGAEGVAQSYIPQDPDMLQRATRLDFSTYLAEDILVKVDRASMLNSLEVRAPLLDFRLVEFAFGKVPTHLKATPTDKKILLKRLTSRVLPPEFDRTRKQGFSIPLSDWLRGGAIRDLFHNVLTDSQTIFNPKAVRQLLEGQGHGRNNSERLFALVLFELWRKEYAVTL